MPMLWPLMVCGKFLAPFNPSKPPWQSTSKNLFTMSLTKPLAPPTPQTWHKLTFINQCMLNHPNVNSPTSMAPILWIGYFRLWDVLISTLFYTIHIILQVANSQTFLHRRLLSLFLRINTSNGSYIGKDFLTVNTYIPYSKRKFNQFAGHLTRSSCGSPRNERNHVS